MIWQDIVFGIGAVIFAVALIPTIRGAQKPPLMTSIPTTVVLLVFAVTQASLSLWVAAITSVFAASLWLTLAVQKIRSK